MSSLAYSRHIHLSDSDLEDEEGESWHVLVGGEDVKVLSTDQLADLYRLSIVDDETLLWQPGMGQWTSLAKVAGLEGDPTAVHHYAELPGGLAPVRFAGSTHAPAVAMHASAPPMAVTIAPPPRAHAPERWLIGAALVVGGLVSLYRTDTLFSLAQAWHQEAAFIAAEQRVLGGPAAHTPRALQGFIEAHAPADPPGLAIPAEWGSVQASAGSKLPAALGSAREAASAMVPGSAGISSARAAAEAPSPSVAPAPSARTTAATGLTSAASSSPVEAGAPRQSGAAAQSATTARPGSVTGAATSAARPAAASGKPRRRSPAGDAVIPGMKPGGSEYDPLNSKL